MLRKISLTVISLALVACAGSDLPEFPTNTVWVAKPAKQRCSKHQVISKDPIKVDKGEAVPWSECVDVIGFDVKDSAAVFQWMRDAQDLAKKRCK